MKQPLQTELPAALQQLLENSNRLIQQQREQGMEYTPIGARESLELMTRRFVTDAPDVPYTRDILIRNPAGSTYPVPVRIYHPDPAHTLPLLIFAHGGGHMAGGVSVYDRIARKLATASKRILISVEYRLAPECPYPSGLDDLEQVIRFVYPALDRLGIRYQPRIGIAGDSGGGALCASAVHRLCDSPGIEMDKQLLIYPSLDYTMSAASIEALGSGYLLESERMAWYFSQYLQHGEDPRKVSPSFMPMPEHYPPTMLVTAGYCPLRDEGFAYVGRLHDAQAVVEHLHFPDMIHAFLNLEDLVPDVCRQFYRAAGDFLRA